jgi:hypothetical protein
MAVILFNCLILGIYDFKDRNFENKWNQDLQTISNILTLCYAAEGALKIIA